MMSELSKLQFVLTNDDGVDAPGIIAMRQAAGRLGRCRIIAPSGPMSGCGHQVTTHAPFQIAVRSAECTAVAGTPVDCVRLALHSLATELDWVFSGVNAGGNLGTDVYHSGTVAAVREAAIRGRPGIAISHFIARGRTIDWRWAEVQASRVLRELLARGCPPGAFWNVNLPHIDPTETAPEIVFCPLDPSPLPAGYRMEGDLAIYSGVYQDRPRRPGGDVDVCFGGRIAATLIRLDGSPAESASGGFPRSGTTTLSPHFL